MKCKCARLKLKVPEGGFNSQPLKRRLIAQCMDCARSYACTANPTEFCLLLGSAAGGMTGRPADSGREKRGREQDAVYLRRKETGKAVQLQQAIFGKRA